MGILVYNTAIADSEILSAMILERSCENKVFGMWNLE